MDFFNETISRAKDVIDVACKKTGEVVTAEKQRFDISVLKSKNEKDYAALGKIYYEKLKNAQTDGAEGEIVSRISGRKHRISELYAEIQKTKKKALCTQCGAAIEKNSVYCNVCGAKVEE